MAASSKSSNPPSSSPGRGWPSRGEDSFTQVWPPFVLSVEHLLKSGQNRLTDRMQPFRIQAFALVRDPRFLSQVEGIWTLAPEDSDGPSEGRVPVMDCLVGEIKGITQVNEFTYDARQEGRARKWFARKAPACLSASSTVVGSLKDILEIWGAKNPLVSSSLTAFKESIDILKDLRAKAS